MRKRLKPILLLVVVIFGSFTLWNGALFSPASAIYVEGVITRDTVWTLTDSPFVVSKNITVCQNATLTIKPGVEVRFGGDFSLIVEGNLSAIGAENNTITFTSNKLQPQAGDWGSIKFNETKSSTLAYCVVEYAKDAIITENGDVKIRNSGIISSSRNGITIVNGTAEVRSNRIVDNFESGIYVTGDNHVVIQNNTISSNKNGILLTGNSTAGVNITENIVMSNTQSGIQLDANDYSDIVILYNILSANYEGFCVSGQASTCITNNSISYNTIGIFYEKGEDHMARYNDIYGNDLSMDVSSNATVNAEYNYWGDESGPNHESLNPTGKGNPVGGDGVNLDFIFFLTAPIGHINARPTARLLTDKTLVAPNQTVTFIATNSSDDGRVDQYSFDFGDGSNSDWITLSIFVYKYSSIGTYHASVAVMDDFGVNSTNVAMVTINVADLTPLQVSVTTSNHTADYGKQVPLAVHVTNGTYPIENANIALLSIIGGSFTNSSGLTNSTGYFITTFTAPNVTRITNVRIIATASKMDYADGSDYKYMKILPPLLVEVTEPTSVESEETTTVTVHVTYSGQPAAEALVVVSADNGSFSIDAKFTDSNGDAEFIFTAPQTLTQQNITITATVAKIGYLEGCCRAIIAVTPKMLVLEVTANPAMLISETISNVTVHVTHNTSPVSNATVTISSDNGGDFSAETGMTDSNGDAIFTFLAPPANTPRKIIVTADATKAGYVGGEDYAQIIVYPGALNVEVAANPAAVESGATSIVIVRVTCNATSVANANVKMSSDNGSFSVNTGITDSDGCCVFNFTAPQVTEELSITITANATKNGYKSGEDRTTISTVLEALTIEVIADPPVIKSEETANVTVHVTCGGRPVVEALVTVSLDGGGNFSEPIGITDANGYCTFVFNAPRTSVQQSVNITATITKTGYVERSDETTVTVEPKVLVVEVAAEPTTLTSEALSQVTVNVTYEEIPIPNATVTISSDNGGNFSAETGITDTNGTVIFNFTAPQASAQLNVTITAIATKIGYAHGEGLLEITVNPGTLNVEVAANPAAVESGAISTVTVRVTCNASPVADVDVTVSSDGGGNLSATTQVTDSAGRCTFDFTAPQTTTELNINITVTVTKNGYVDGGNQTKLTINPGAISEPGGAGLPLTTILLIAVPILLVAAVALLIKLKVISISWKKE